MWRITASAEKIRWRGGRSALFGRRTPHVRPLGDGLGGNLGGGRSLSGLAAGLHVSGRYGAFGLGGCALAAANLAAAVLAAYRAFEENVLAMSSSVRVNGGADSIHGPQRQKRQDDRSDELSRSFPSKALQEGGTRQSDHVRPRADLGSFIRSTRFEDMLVGMFLAPGRMLKKGERHRREA
jgi:hypothetical protein